MGNENMQGAALERALKLLQERDDGLSQEELVNMISVFVENMATVAAYLALERDDIRRAWMKKMLYPSSQ